MKNHIAVKIDDRNITSKQRGFYGYERVLEVARVLSSALEAKDKAGIIEVFQDRLNIRSMVLLRGEGNEYLNLVQESFSFLVKKEGLALVKEDFEKLIKYLERNKISEFILNELMTIAYHQQNEIECLKLRAMMIDSEDFFKNKKVYFWVLHSVASWYEVFEKNNDKAIEYNKRVIVGIGERDRVLQLKAKFGLTYNKELLPKQKVKDFLYFAEEFLKKDNLYDAFRAVIEAARASLHQVKQLGLEKNAFEVLDDTKTIILKALKIAKEINYPNLEIISADVMSEFYRTRIEKISFYLDKNGNDAFIQEKRNKSKGDLKKMESFMKRAQVLREQYSYKTKFVERYKRTYYNQIG